MTATSKERLGAATRRERQDEDLEVAPPAAQRPAPAKMTLTDLAFGPLVEQPVTARPGKVSSTLFAPADVLADDALRSVEDMLARSGVRQPRVDRRATQGADRASPEAVAAAMTHSAASSAGAALPAELVTLMGARLGADLSAIRVHTDDAAHRAATAIGADAFTVGDHIYFARGQYQPGEAAGVRLIAHEVAHAVQQRSSGRGGFLEASMPGDSQEVDAEAFAARILAEIARFAGPGDLSDPAAAVEHARTHGTPIDLPLKEEMERHFGVSFDYVKAYTGPAAELACQVMSAAAFVVHDLVVLADPSPKRDVLLHELTHIMQMRDRRSPARYAPGSLTVSSPDSEAEHEASVFGLDVPRVTAPANVVHRTKTGQQAQDSSTLEDRAREFHKIKAKEIKEFKEPEKRPFGAKAPAENTSYPMYRHSLERPFMLRHYQDAIRTKFPNAKTDKDLQDLFNQNESLVQELRISRVDSESSPSYVLLGGNQKWQKVVFDHRPRRTPKDEDQFPYYAAYVTKIQAKPSKPLAKFDVDPADEETAKQYRTRLREALAIHYSGIKNGWKKFHTEIVVDNEIFGSPHQRIQGDAFAEIVAKTPLKTKSGAGAAMTATEPQFQPDDLADLGIDDKVFARGDGYVNVDLKKATMTIMAECKAVTTAPTAEHKKQIAAYALVTGTPGCDGYFSEPQSINKQNVKKAKFTHVAFFFSFTDSKEDKQKAIAWRDEIHKAFNKDLKRFSIVPPPDGKYVYEIQLNPVFRFQGTDENKTTHVFNAPMQRHPGVNFKRATIQTEAGSSKVKGGSVAMDLDMAGALQAKNVEKKIEPAGDVGPARVENKFDKFKSQLDKVLGKVDIDARLTDDGAEATIKLKQGAAKIPGFDVNEASLTATLNGEGNLAVTGKIGIAHKKSNISGEIEVRWDGGWVFTGTVHVPQGLVDGLNAFDASVTYGKDKLVIAVDNVDIEKKFKGITITGSARGVTYDVKKDGFSGMARLEADLGAFGKAAAEGEFEDNKIKRAEFSYDSPELVYPPKSQDPVFKGTIGGTLTYADGKFAGKIRGTADFNVPMLKKFGNPDGLGLTVDASVKADGTYSGSIATTKPIFFGDHIKVPAFRANLEEDGTANAKFSIELVKVAIADNAKIDCAIDKDGFKVTGANYKKSFGNPEKDKFSGELALTYAEGKGLEIGGTLNAQIRPGFVATGTFTYNTETKLIDAKLTTTEISLIKSDPIEKTLFEVKRKIPVFNVMGIGIYIDIGFDLKFNMNFNLGMKPTIKLNKLSLEKFDYESIGAEIEFIGGLIASLTGTPKVGLGIFVLAPELLSGGGGLQVPIVGKMEAKPTAKLNLTYSQAGGIEGGATLGFALAFGITGAVEPYAEFSVLKDMWNPKWKGDPLKSFTILEPRDLINVSIDLGGDLSKPKDAKPPEKDAAPARQDPVGDHKFDNSKEKPEDAPKTSVPATPERTENPPPDPGKTSPGFDIDMLMGKLEEFGPVQTLKKIVNTAAEVWEKIKGAIGYIVKIVKNWFNSAVEAIESILKGIAEKGLVRYLGDVVKERVGDRVYRIISPLFEKFANVEDKMMSLLDEPFPTSVSEAPGWIWGVLKKLLNIGWSTIDALVSAVSEIVSNIADAVGDLLTYAVERGMIGVERHAYWAGVPYVYEYDFLAATEYKIDILGSGIYYKEPGNLDNPKSAVGIALYYLLEEYDVPPTNTEIEPDSGEPYNDRWVGGRGAL